MEEPVSVNDMGQGYGDDGDFFQEDQLNMDINLDLNSHLLLDLNEEDLSEIHRMVDEWEFNFGSLESSDGEELVRLVQLDNQFVCPRPTSITTDSTATNSTITERFNNVEELHDRLPSYYTALAPSRSAPWISPASHQVFNKLPAYITDIAPLDSANVTTCGQPGKKKLNLAEYRTRREKQLQQMQEEEEQHKKQQPHHSCHQQQEEQQQQQTKEETRVKVEKDKNRPTKESTTSSFKDEPEEGEVEEDANEEANEPIKSRLSRKESDLRKRSSRSPTRSYSSDSRSSSSRRYRSSSSSTSSSSSSSSSSYSSRSRSRSPRYRRRRRHSRSPSWRRSSRHSRRRTPTPPSRSSRGYGERNRRQAERQRQIEERRVIYVGKIAEGTTRADLRRRFECFGPVVDISLHFRERGDNYGFVTFAYKVDAYEAVEHGNDDPHQPKYDLSFGGRRAFCKETYADLDAVDDDGRSKANEVDFETLLRAVQVQLHRRPCS